MKQYV